MLLVAAEGKPAVTADAPAEAAVLGVSVTETAPKEVGGLTGWVGDFLRKWYGGWWCSAEVVEEEEAVGTEEGPAPAAAAAAPPPTKSKRPKGGPPTKGASQSSSEREKIIKLGANTFWLGVDGL